MKLDFRHGIPAEVLAHEAHRLHETLTGPTLFHIPGQREPALFVSVLQHGNETTGWEAIRGWLQERDGRPLPRSLLLFVANPAAARERRRRLDSQPDFNRCWPGAGDSGASPVHRVLAEVSARAHRTGLFASIDIHNNSGRNPHYSASTRRDPEWIYLMHLFDRRGVYFRQPHGVQCEAFSDFCPAITVECGLAGSRGAIEHCREYLDRVMELERLPQDFNGRLDLYHTVARVTVAPGLHFSFGPRNPGDTLQFRIDLDALNFVELPAGTPLAEGDLGPLHTLVEAHDEAGNEITERYFEVSGEALRTRVPFTPSMFSREPRIVRQDCLCYVMERISSGGAPP